VAYPLAIGSKAEDTRAAFLAWAEVMCEPARKAASMNMSVREWFDQRSFRYQEFTSFAEPGHTGQRLTTTLVLPTRNVAETIGPILAQVARLNDRSGLIDQVMLVDADSTDGTGDIARGYGAEVYSENELLPAFGPAAAGP